MKITFRLNWEDWRAYERLVKKTDWVFLMGALLLLITGGLQLENDRTLPALLQRGDWLSLALTIGHAYKFLIGFVVALKVLKILQQWLLKGEQMFKNATFVGADEKGIHSTIFNKNTPIFWNDVGEIEETPTHLFVLNLSRVGIVIPKRAFASQIEATQFIGYVRQQTAKARSDTPPIAQP